MARLAKRALECELIERAIRRRFGGTVCEQITAEVKERTSELLQMEHLKR
jgi:hypothetical protein